jgi:hypothetical protein
MGGAARGGVRLWAGGGGAEARGRESVRKIALTTYAWRLAGERGEPRRSIRQGCIVAVLIV